MKSLQGYLLVAAPNLGDVFVHSVVLLVRHNEEGAFGVILNRPTNTTVKEAWERVCDLPCLCSDTIFVGGPCEGPLMAIHDQEFLMEIEILPGLYFSAGRDKLERLVVREESPIKFFAGYAGWAAGQLESELRRGAWLTMPASVEHIFQGDEAQWSRLMRERADAALISTLKIKHVPQDPSLN